MGNQTTDRTTARLKAVTAQVPNLHLGTKLKAELARNHKERAALIAGVIYRSGIAGDPNQAYAAAIIRHTLERTSAHDVRNPGHHLAEWLAGRARELAEEAKPLDADHRARTAMHNAPGWDALA